MNEIYGYRSKKGIVFLAEGREQSLFKVGRTIIAGRANRELLQALNNAPRDDIEQYLRIAYEGRQTDLLLGSREKRKFRMFRLGTGQRASQEISSFGSISRLHSKYEIESSASGEKLEEMVEYLFNLTKDDSLQFGFIDRYNAKLLFSPETTLSLPPTEYEKRGEFNQKLYGINSEFYELLARNLEISRRLRQKKSGIRSALHKLKTLAVGSELSDMREANAELIETYLDYRHGPLERFRIKSIFTEQKQEQARIYAPRRYSRAKQLSLQQRLDRELMPKHERSLIVRLRKNSIGEHRVFAGHWTPGTRDISAGLAGRTLSFLREQKRLCTVMANIHQN